MKSIVFSKVKPPKESISITWWIEDIQSLRPDSKREQAAQVLNTLKTPHNAEIGVNWDVIRTVCDDLYPSKFEEDDSYPQILVSITQIMGR